MTRHLRLNDEVFDVQLNRVTMVVSSAEMVAGHVRVLNVSKGTEELVPYEKIRQQVGEGALRVRRQGAPKVSAAQAQSAVLDEQTLRALEIVRDVKEHASTYEVSHAKAYEAVKTDYEQAMKEGEQAPFPSRATVYKYLKRHLEGIPVVFASKNKGNRTPRYDGRVVDLVKAVCKRELLKPNSKWTIRDVTAACNQQLQDDGLLLRTQKLSRKFVGAVLFKQLTADPDLARTDPKLRAAKKAVAKNRLRIDGLLQRVEQDALHLPWRLRTDFGDAKNIYIVHAIDCATSTPLGFVLVIGSPRESDGFRCIERYLFSKQEWFEALSIQNGPDLYGTPVVVVFDNGPESGGERMMRTTEVGIAPVWLKSRNPQKKPFIERLNKSLKEALQTLPGCTRFDDEDGMRDPELLADLPMPLDEFKTWLARFFFEAWVNKPLERFVNSIFVDDRELGNTPRERFENMAYRDGHVYPLPPDPNAWRMVKYVHDERTLSRKSGISLHNFRFRGPYLPLLIERFGETVVKVLSDPDDFRRVWVRVDEELIELTNIDTDETTPAYSFQEAKAMLKEAGLLEDEREEVRQFRRDLFARSTMKSSKQVEDDAASAAGENRRVARQARKGDALERAKASPVPPAPAARTPSGDTGLSSVPSLPVYNRNTGEAL